MAFFSQTATGPLNGIMSLISYPCPFPKTGGILMFLLSKNNALEKNLMAYKTVLATLRAYGDQAIFLEEER
jgi:hypothetical protein